MKRMIISCLMAVGIWLTAMATNTVALTSVQGHSGDEVEVQAMLTNEATVTALEIQIPLDDALSYVDGSATLNADRSNGHVLSAAVVDGKLRIYVYSTSLTPIKGAEGLLCSFKLKLGKKPAVYSLMPKVILSDATGHTVESAGKCATVTLLAPQIEVATSQVDFGHIPIRSTYTQSLYIRNTGTEPLTISHIDLGCAELKASPPTCTIAAGITQEFVLTYSPVQWGTMETEVTITSDAVNPKAGKAKVKADPYSVNELHVQRAEGVSDSEVTVALKMNNMEPITAAQSSFTLPEGLVYVEGSAAAGSRCYGTNHTATGSVVGNRLTLYLYSMDNSALPEGDGELMTFRLSLKGQSGYYRLNPENVILGSKTLVNMTSAVSSDYVVIQSPIFSGAEEVKFTQASIIQKAKANYTVHNTGSENLVVSKVTFLAEGYGVEEVLPLTVPPNTSRDLTVCYSPTAKGQHGTTMNIYTNDPNNRMMAVRLQGEVYEPNSITVCYTQEANGAYAYHFGMDNYTDIVAVQFDLRCSDGMTAVVNEAKASERLKNHSHDVVDMGNGVYRVLIYSFGNKAIEGNSGLLLTVPFIVAEGVNATSVEAENIVLSNREGTNSASYIVEWEDVTNNIVNADFSSRSNGWSGTEFTAANRYIAEQWNKTFDNYQVLKGMKAGHYKLTCQGFYRYGSIDNAKTNFKKGTEKLNAVLYMNEAQKPFVSIFSEDYYTLDPYNYPDNVTQANTAFNTYGLYTGNVVEYNLKSDGDLKIGMKKEVAVDADWVIFDNFRLYYKNVIAAPVVYSVSEIQLSEEDVAMEGGERIKLIATVLPDNVTDRNVVWSVADKQIAIVSNDGTVTGLKTGSTIVTATSISDPEFSVNCRVTVTSDYVAPPSGWILPWGREEAWTMKYKFFELADYVEPANDANGKTWKELGYSDTSWETLTGPMGNNDNCNYFWEGENNCFCLRRTFFIPAVGNGFYKFYANHDDGIEVYINGRLVAEYNDWTQNQDVIYVIPNEAFTKGDNQLAIYIKQLEVDAELDYGLYYESVDPVIELDLSSLELTLKMGEYATLKATTNESAYNKSVIWSVENSAVATVSSTGRVKGVQTGTTIITATSVSNPEISASCTVTVTSEYVEQGDLPDVPFEFFFDAANYDAETQSIPNHKSAALSEYQLQLSATIPTTNGDYLTFNDRCEGYINRWGKESTESGAYFHRKGQDNMTIVCKVKPRLDTGNASDFISNRSSIGYYNYMFRIGDHNSVFLHTGTAYSDDRALKLSYSDEPQILVVRVNGSENYIQIENLTTDESHRVYGINWGGSNTAMKFFYNDSGEYWSGDFYWMYYSFQYLNDEELSAFMALGENKPQKGDVNGDGNVNIADAIGVVNYVLKQETNTFVSSAVDMNGDGNINIADAIAIVNQILKM